jgi:DNA-directed RNA polymerase II subunit RPB2
MAAASDSLSSVGLEILERYFKENEFPLTRHHIDSYEKAVFDEIPSIIHSINPIVFLKEPLDKDGSVFAYRVEIFIGGDALTPDRLALTISPPVVALDGGATVRRLFPNEARLRNLTYAAQINADILFRVTFTKPREGPGGGFDTEVKEAPVVRNFPLMQLPILLRSRLCATGVADAARLEEMGECRNDYGGYFIVRGAEKVLITREEQAFNTLYVEKKATIPADPVQAYASVVSLNPQTKQTRRVAMYLGREGEIRVAIPMVRGAFPLFILFRAMGLESDEEIVRMIFPDQADNLAEELVPSIEDAYPIMNKYTATRYIMTLTKGFTEAHVLDILQNLMLPHVPDEPLARAQYLAEMARETVRANAGLRTKSDRDDMRGHRFLTTGVLVRELFNACYKEWRKSLILTIDTTYRANAALYQGEAVFDLFRTENNNLEKLFQPQLLNQAIMRGFGGRWGTNPENEKSGVLQPLARISYLDATSHQRRVVSDFDSGMKTTGPRKLNTSQLGFFCTSETPTGAHIGLTKNISIMTQFSFGAPMQPLYDWMRMKGGLIPVADTTAPQRATAAVVQINGGTVGFTMDPRGLTRVLKLLKWNACLAPTASVSFNTMEKTVRILLDEGRPVRPLWHLNGEGAAFLARMADIRSMPWRSLVLGTLPATRGAGLSSVRFLDPLADNPAATPADYEAALAPTAGFIEYCDPVEMNEAYVSWWGTAEELQPEHTHVEIHPSTMMGLMASMIPYSNHNQAPRNQLSNSQSKQGIGYMATNIHNRFDTYASQLCYGEAPLCRTFYYENIGNGQMPYGYNCIVGVASDTGYNQDDGLIFNRDSIARGMFRSISFRSYDCAEETDSHTKVHSHVANPGKVPAWTSLRPGLDYSKLDERGIIREGTIVDDKTVLVGRYMVVPDTNDIKDASVTPGLHTQGRVDAVVVLHQADGQMLVKVRVIEMRVPALGDKFSTRHGQKGTIGMFVAAADLPRTAEGLVPDLMVNPGGLISRMTVAQLVEAVAGRVGAEVAAKFNATTFCNDGEIVGQLGDVLQALGFSRGADNIMYCGTTGKQLQTEIFMCPLYFMRLRHLTEDKVNARGAGRREMRTHQPTGGRANEGGLRIGEMERDSLCAHGVSTFLQESMMKRGDGTTFWICNGCGRVPIYNEAEGLFVCPSCDGPLTYTGVTPETLTLQLPTRQSRVTFSRVAMPYTLKLLDQELTTFMNAGFRFVSEGAIARLRDTDWAWPMAEVEFKAMGRGVEAAGDVNPEARAAADAEVAAAAKPKRKTTGAGAAAGAQEGPVAGAEGATAVLAAAAAAAGEGGDALVAGGGLGPIRFYSKLQNEYIGFSNFASAAFRMSGVQIPAPDGTTYPEFGVAANGAPDPAKQTWPTVEHYYQAMKFPADPEWQEAIRQATTPARAKKMGLSAEHPLRGDWDQVKERVMKAALLAKFRQNPALLAMLQQTGTRELVEAAPGDSYWGSGTRGKGLNRMGRLLMEVRDELKDVRLDASVLGGVQAGGLVGQVVEEAGDNAGVVSEPEDVAEEARQIVAEATGGVIQLPQGSAVSGPAAAGGGGAESLPAAPVAPVQSGGVYMIINPSMGGMEHKARRARQRGGGPISWAGMPTTMDVQKDGADGQEGQEDSGGRGDGPLEVTVQKVE